MEAHIKVQLDLNSRIKNARSNFKKSPKDRLQSIDYLSTRLDLLEELWSQFNLTHTQLVQDSDSKLFSESLYVTKGVYEHSEEAYIDYKFELKSAISKLKTKDTIVQSEITQQTNKSNVRLPIINIPVFSGKHSEWTTFKDLFLSLIHNNESLDNVQRLHYLKSHLAGEAEQLLRHVSVSQENYIKCWEQLKKRYDNKKYLANHILQRLFGQRILLTESASALKELLDTTNECLHALSNIGVDVKSWDVIVIHVMCSKLDSETRKQWEIKSCELSDDLPTLKQFNEFLETRYRALEFIDPKMIKPSIKTQKSPNVPITSKIHHVTATTCAYCSEEHRISNCKGFGRIGIDARRNFVQSSRLCFNCLGSNHTVYTCRLTTRCRICHKKHHSLLHPTKVTSETDGKVKDSSVTATATQSTAAGSSVNGEPSTNQIRNHFSTMRKQVLLATARVNVQSRNGRGTTLRCLVDQGSQASLITESAVQILGLKKIAHKSTISGLGNDERDSLASKSKVNIKIQSRLDPKHEFCVTAFVLNKLTSVLPEKRVVVELWSEFSGLELADPSFDKPDKVDLLLGADIYGQILLEGVVKGPPGTPMAQQTALGWILSGPVHTCVPVGGRNISVNHISLKENELLKRFWELEADISALPPKDGFTHEEKTCEEIYSTTTKRDSTGRYIVKLPFRSATPNSVYGNSEIIATRRFLQLEKRFYREPELKARYADVIQEYIELGHMQMVSKEEQYRTDTVYLPHHAVVREDKTTSKVRVVFDASCPGTNGVSLNQDLLIGPTLQPDLRHLILKWRKYPICLVADIVKMYRQVNIDKPDTDFQRILWRRNSDDPLKHYRLLTVTFGTAAAPYLAVRTLHQLAHDDGKAFPLATERVLHHFYMDDLLTGCETVEEGKQVHKELLELLARGGFELQKWTTNNSELMKEIKGHSEEEEMDERLTLKQDAIVKILGLTWNRRTDEFEYSVQVPSLQARTTKRSVVSDIARLFDPLGWLQPIIITAKVLIQKLWLSGIDWDDELPPPLLKEWLKYRDTLRQLSKFKLPRWIYSSSSDDTFELHGFSDASNIAYAAVVYVRTKDKDGNVHVSLLTAKTKVAPIKQVSIPRLELCGAVLLTRLLKEVAEVMDIAKCHLHAWTDSTVVLSWLNSRPNRWKTFVANRVSEIITSIEPHQWSHVTSKDNPADCASRGTSQSIDEDLWKSGPPWLKRKHKNYKKIAQNDTNLEEKLNKAYLVNTCALDDTSSPEKEIMSKFSSLNKLIRVVSFCRRFFYRGSRENLKSWLTSDEIRKSLFLCIRLVQESHFKEELADLKVNKHVSKRSKFTSLNPIVDEDGILRIGGRLQHAQISEELKHPIILPQNSHFSDLVIADAHVRTLHGSAQLMLNYLRSKFWVIGAKHLVKTHVRKCVTCVRYAASIKHPLMGQLPAARGSASRAFSHSGVDYAGPVTIRTCKGRGHHAYKGYICLFICMATRAVHLEPVSDLSSQGFLAAFKRFTARRGHCSELWSDNGTNFVGAARELKQLFADEKTIMAKEIADHLATNGTKWHFIPPYSPNFGGLWEAGIKSTKYHLKRIIGNSTLTYEEMATVLSQVEACLNSRPISRISDDGNDPLPLTPGHFLVGEPLLLAPDHNYETSNISSLRRWQLCQKMVQDFWRRWSREYLSQFYHRYKWNHQTPEPAVGDVVLVKEDDLPPAKWLYGIITEKHSGLDGITRVVSLKCSGNIIKRPVGKLCFLPLAK